ncbi:XdhC family protein [Geomonas azotofigens]|uniref:XdhC family protein n=1 Tax=Geomonas azotofigens TaxID=2843196 RepID=UPI001C122855|nr:XdhC family protein [Geomonas azotofigens]MBU5613842.1 XdhC family protein [Geomonas azotofigens]
MWDWIGKLDELRRQGQGAVLVTVIKSGGSTPGKSGAKMVVLADGSFFGTVGGGPVEHHAREEGMNRLQSGESGTVEISLKQSNDSDFPACGGTVQLYLEVLNAEPRVYIFGAGHVGQALSRVLQGTAFRVHLVDERTEWIGAPEIPDGVVRHSSRWSDFIAQAAWCDRRSYVVIVSYNGAVDQEILREVLSRPSRYVGMIGSRAKWGKVKENLAGVGLDLDRVRCPIGQDNGGGAPQEIAVAIASELLSVHYGPG